MKIAVLGIGLMGYPIGRRLCEAGFDVQAWNRTRAKAERLQTCGATVHDTPAKAVAQADIVIAVLDYGVAAALRPGSLFIDMSSIKPIEARDHAAHLSELGVDYLDATVSSGTIGAEQGSLAIMAGGNAADFARGPRWSGSTGQAGKPDDCGHYHRRGGRSTAAVQAWRCRYGQG